MSKRFQTAPLSGAKGEAAAYTDNPFQPYWYGEKGRDSSEGAVLQPSDELLLDKGGVRALNMYTRLLLDATVQSAISRLVQDITSRDIVVEPFSELPGDKVVAEYVENQINNLPMDEIYRGFSEAIITGCSYGEIIWNRTRAGIIAKEVRMKDPRRFLWQENPEAKRGFNLRVATRGNQLTGEKVPERKIIPFRYYISNNGDPYGQGVGRILYPLLKFRRRAQESQVLYSDRFANPTVVVTAPLSATVNEINTLYGQITNLSQETAIILPEGYNYDFANPQGNGEVFEQILKNLAKEIHILITGEAETGNPDAGSRASSEVAQTVRTVRASELSQLISKQLRDTLVRWIVDFNFGVNVMTPNIRRDFRLEESSSLNVSDIVLLNEGTGLLPTQDWIANHFKVELHEESKRVASEEDKELGRLETKSDEDILESLFETKEEENQMNALQRVLTREE